MAWTGQGTGGKKGNGIDSMDRELANISLLTCNLKRVIYFITARKGKVTYKCFERRW